MGDTWQPDLEALLDDAHVCLHCLDFDCAEFETFCTKYMDNMDTHCPYCLAVVSVMRMGDHGSNRVE